MCIRDRSEQLKTVDSAADLLFSNRTIQTQLMNYRNTTSIAEKKLDVYKRQPFEA